MYQALRAFSPIIRGVQSPEIAMKLRFVVTACLISLLAACAVHTPRGSVIVDPDGYGHGQRHCPPGQAKKGNC